MPLPGGTSETKDSQLQTENELLKTQYGLLNTKPIEHDLRSTRSNLIPHLATPDASTGKGYI